MTRDDILKLADKHAVLTAGWMFNAKTLERIVREAMAIERENCAKLLEDFDRFGDTRDCVAAIRGFNINKNRCPPCNNNCNQGRNCPAWGQLS